MGPLCRVTTLSRMACRVALELLRRVMAITVATMLNGQIVAPWQAWARQFLLQWQPTPWQWMIVLITPAQSDVMDERTYVLQHGVRRVWHHTARRE